MRGLRFELVAIVVGDSADDACEGALGGKHKLRLYVPEGILKGVKMTGLNGN